MKTPNNTKLNYKIRHLFLTDGLTHRLSRKRKLTDIALCIISRRYKIVITLFFLCSSIALTAQDVMFSQFYNTPVLVNPAQTGFFEGTARAGITYRNQWAAVMTNPYETFAIELEAKVKKATEKTGPLSVGITVMRDRAGASQFSISHGMLSIGYMQQLDRRNFLGAGIQGGYGQYTIDYANLFWGSQYNPQSNTFDASLNSNETHIYSKYNHYKVSGGLLYSYNSVDYDRATNKGYMIYAGGSYMQNFIPESSFYENAGADNNSAYVFHGGAQIAAPQYNISIIPHIIFASQDKFNQFVFGSTFRYKAQNDATAFNMGLYYRLNDALIPCVGFEFNALYLGIAYDANVSELGKQTKQTSGLEFNLVYTLNPFTKKSFE